VEAAINWDEVVGIGTLALAIATGLMVFFTHRLASKTADLALETAEDVRSSARPVLIDPSATEARMESGGAHDSGTLVVRVYNAGPGPALNVDADVYVATTSFDRRTRSTKIGNVAPNTPLNVVIIDVPNVDTSGSHQSYLALRLNLTYSDLGGRRYYTVIRLSDPGKGQRRGSTDRQWHDLEQDGTEVGEGMAPPPQWRVGFSGKLADDERARLHGGAIQLLAATATGSSSTPTPPEPAVWRYSAMVTARTRDDAIAQVQGVLGADRFQAWSGDPWTGDRLYFGDEK
jgi:hypothetical protein